MTSINNFGGINGDEALDGLTKPVRDGFLKGIRAGHEKVETGADNALSGAMEAGISLHAVKARISIPMTVWMDRYQPSIPPGSWKLYLRLAAPHNRAVIEAVRASGAKLSINAARKLITKKKPATDPDEPATDPVETAVPTITDEQLIAALTLRGPEWMLEHMPGWRAWLVAKLRGVVLRDEQIKHPDTRMKNIKIPSTQHLKLVHSVEPPTQH